MNSASSEPTVSTPCNASTQAASGLNPTLKKFVFAPLMMAGAMSTHADTPTTATPAKTDPTADDVVALPTVEVQGAKPKELSSPKFTQPLVDTPQTIAVVPKEVFNQQGAATLSDVLRNTPGITFTAGEGGSVASGDTFTMRGFDTSGSIFIDGVRDSGAYSRDVYNIEQVEIAKGPSGADNGRGGASGYVNLATKTPKLENFTTGTASYGVSENGGKAQRRASLDYNQSLDKSPVAGTAFRLNIMGQDSGVPGRDVAENTGWGVSPSLALGLGTPTRVTIAGAYNSQDNIPDSGMPAVALPDTPLYSDPIGASTTLVPYTSPFGAIDQSNFYGLDGDYEHILNRSLTVRVEHDLTPDLKLSNQTKLVATDRDALVSYIQSGTSFDPAAPAASNVTLRRIRTQTDNKMLSNQTNLTASLETGPVSHDLSTGLDLSRETQFSPTWTAVNGPSTSLTNPDPSRPVLAGQTPTLAANNPYARAQIDTAALYAFDTVHLTKKLLLNLSGRLEHYKADFTTLTSAPLFTRLKADDTLFSWKSGLVFKPVPAGSLYVAYGTGFTPPGTTFSVSTTPGNANNPATEPQESNNAEIGVKWDFFDSRLSTSLAFYRSENNNVAVNIGTVPAPVIVYDTRQISEGVEFGVSGKITPEWLVFGGLGYIQARTESPSTPTTDGADLRYTPRLSGNLWTTYALPFHLTIGGGAQYSESVSRSNNTTVAGSATNATEGISAIEVPDYWLFNALAAYEVNKHLTIRLNVNNVFDQFYYRLNNNGGRYYAGSPRTYVLSADFTF